MLRFLSTPDSGLIKAILTHRSPRKNGRLCGFFSKLDGAYHSFDTVSTEFMVQAERILNCTR
ncbi:hypothetical protein LEP1GSC040_0631 [Leptospira santarosai str. 2000030832]|nr:hypothetical protein LEP1GSC040_0631 [Leptospira santarosai str. 2000030832]